MTADQVETHEHHTHEHSHTHHHTTTRRSLFYSFLMVSVFMVVEAAGGWYTNSLALLSDAGHMLTDAGALAFSLLALKVGELPPSTTKTFGYRRFEILAALANGLALWVIVGVILHEAYTRLHSPPEVKAPLMIVVAGIGLAINLVSIKLLHAHKDENLNVHGAFLHVLADSLGSVGALAAGIVMLTLGWRLIDPLISLGICILILWSSWGVVRDAVNILVLGVPLHIDYREVEEEIRNHPGVCCIYDLHIWTIASGLESISAHVVVPDGYARQKELLAEIVTSLETRFGIQHATIQIEESHELKNSRGDSACMIGSADNTCTYPTKR